MQETDEQTAVFLRVPQEVVDALTAVARRDGVSRNNLVQRYLTRALEAEWKKVKSG